MSAVQNIALEEIMAEKLGSIDPSKYPNETFDLYSIPSYDNKRPEIVTGSKIGSTKQIVMPGDILLSKIVPHIRRAWAVGENRERRIIASGEWIVFRSERFYSGYLRHVLLADSFHSKYMQTVSGVGGSLLRARPAHVAKITIPMPALSEQRRIAEVLDRAEELRAKRRAALAQLDTLTQSIFLDMFGDPYTNSKRFSIVQFVDICERIFKGAFDLKASSYKSEGIPFIRIADIQNNTISLSNAVFVDENTYSQYSKSELISGDLVFSKVGTIDRIALIPDSISRCIISQNNVGAKLRLNIVNSSYALAFITTPYALDKIRAGSKKAVQDKLVLEELRKLPFILPPLQLQSEFANRIKALDNLRMIYLASMEEFNALFSSLQHRAFRGEL